MQHLRRRRAHSVRVVEKFATRQNFRGELLRQKSSAAIRLAIRREWCEKYDAALRSDIAYQIAASAKKRFVGPSGKSFTDAWCRPPPDRVNWPTVFAQNSNVTRSTRTSNTSVTCAM
jgi:hypothetical protein